ncbi:MAG: S-layer homology domain-containing protein, partial [Oscillospiraceae bacterium]|nr:S-layer homology domain-containing protein [Oscillospiraceae bacterium]
SDVVSGKYYTEAVAWAEGEGIVDGYGNGLFGPEDDITRQDLALLFLRCARYKGVKLPEIRAYADFDDDKDVSGYAQEATETMYKAGIISGKPGNRLDPKGTATRAEVAAMLRRFLESVQQ